MHYRVAFLGFSDFERGALASYFRLAHNRTPCYEQVATLTDADFLVADADHGPSVQLVLATERSGETVFIGAVAPPGSMAWMVRPIDALHVMRELDAMVGLGGVAAHADAAPKAKTTAIQSPRRPRADAVRRPAPVRMAAPAPIPASEPAPAPTSPPPVSLLERAHAPQAPRPARPAPAAFKQPEPVLVARPSVSTPSLPPSLPPSPPPVAPSPPAPPAVPRALLVDDSELALRYLASRLGRWPLDIDSASDSAQALDLLDRHSYDLVFLDIELGEDSELDGLALCQHVKQSPTLMNAAVILVSAHHSELDRVRGALAGCDAYLGKPLDEVELQRLLLRQGLKAPQSESATQA